MVEEEVVASWSKCDFQLILFHFSQQLLIFYHSRLDDEHTGIFVSQVEVANNVETKVVHKMTPKLLLVFPDICYDPSILEFRFQQHYVFFSVIGSKEQRMDLILNWPFLADAGGKQ